ncbi:hypothetical protein [Kiloniella sp.]|uniref:hypothetical protein n=1 Tax=Kiloniella sp. TaxID=1938587 RepID=UPI003B01A5AB
MSYIRIFFFMGFILTCSIDVLSSVAFADRDPNRNVLCVTQQIQVSNRALDKAMDACRPEGPIKK